MNGQQQSSLQNIYSRSFPGNNLFEISLVKDTNPELPFYKSRYFLFISMTPSAQNEQGQKTFNKDGRVTLKTECEKLMGLANSIRAYARGQDQLGQFAIFVDSTKSGFSGGGTKLCFASSFVQKQQNDTEVKKIAISCKIGQNKPFGVTFSIPEAMAIADIFDFIGKKGLELEFENRQNVVGQTSNKPFPPPQNQSQQNPQTPQSGDNPVVDNFVDSMYGNIPEDDIPF